MKDKILKKNNAERVGGGCSVRDSQKLPGWGQAIRIVTVDGAG